MASHLRGGYPGAIYHVTCRMVGYAPSLRGYAGESQRDVAELLNMGSRSSVCKQLAALPGEEQQKGAALPRQHEKELNNACLPQ